MRRPSLPSVRVLSPDWRQVFRTLENWATALAGADPNVLGVLLYGSLARGDYAPGSDADLIVVVAGSPYPPAERPYHLPPLRLPICHEILVYTEAELSRLQQEGWPFVRRALAEGRWLAGSNRKGQGCGAAAGLPSRP
jgi:nucleotidyltransferase-like protein